MRLKSISLSWFRGAAASATLTLNGRSAVVFGVNGAGKSSFVDGIEASLCGGKVGHLGHEYSGRNQEKGLVNTERPPNAATNVEIALSDGSKATSRWTTGAAIMSSEGPTRAADWDYRRTALRQEELSDFIRATKGAKYSAVLPLLGLSNLEAAGENLHKLAQTVDRKSELPAMRSQVNLARERRKEAFGDKTNDQLLVRLEELRLTYAADAPVESALKTVGSVLEGVERRIASLDGDNRKAAAIGEVAASDLPVRLGQVRILGGRIAEVSEPLIKERLDVLGAAGGYVEASVGKHGLIPCPACGREIDVVEFREHVANERERLSSAAALYADYHAAVGDVCDEVVRLRNVVLKDDLKAWRGELEPSLEEGARYLESIPLADLRKACAAADIQRIEDKVGPLLLKSVEDARKLPPQVQTLVDDQNQSRALKGSLDSSVIKARIGRVEALIALTRALESGVREEIKDRARATFESISGDVQRYWKVLQPLDVITGIRLQVPEESEKAIEVCLRFHGKEQDSPRLTLSEGQRNALGLCIFLAMANKASATDTPIVLDDVVISFDREHRSQVAKLLIQEFASRQVILFTHDREWYFELQRMLPQGNWDFHRIAPYSSPAVGITFADHGLDFATARARAKTDPEEALGNVRRIMDVSLSEIAERIGLPLPHLRGDHNDNRTAGQFLVALERAASKAFQKRDGEGYVSHVDGLAALKKVKPEMAVWANRGAHTFSGSAAEAEELIDDSEAVLNAFKCEGCNTPIGAFEGSGGKSECRCGALRWRPI